MVARRRRRAAASGISEDLAALAALGLDPGAPIWSDARLLVDGRLLAAVHGRLVDELGEEEAYWRLYQAGALHGLRDADRVARAAAEPPALPAESGAIASLPLAIALRPLAPAEDAAGGSRAALALLGAWPEALEASARRSACGPAAGPSCGLSAGYTAGWLSGAHECELLVLETECVATGGARCAFEAREPAAFGDRDSGRARALLERVPIGALRGAALAPESAAHALPSQRELPEGSTLVDVWGPVMVLPFVDPDDALRLVEVVRRDPGTREVRVVVIDLRGLPLDEAFGAAALESVLECLGQWGAEAVLTGVSPLADAAVRELEERHLVVRKDAAEAIATAFQIAAAQRRAW